MQFAEVLFDYFNGNPHSKDAILSAIADLLKEAAKFSFIDSYVVS